MTSFREFSRRRSLTVQMVDRRPPVNRLLSAHRRSRGHITSKTAHDGPRSLWMPIAVASLEQPGQCVCVWVCASAQSSKKARGIPAAALDRCAEILWVAGQQEPGKQHPCGRRSAVRGREPTPPTPTDGDRPLRADRKAADRPSERLQRYVDGSRGGY